MSTLGVGRLVNALIPYARSSRKDSGAVFIGCWAAMGHVPNGGTDHGLRMRDDAMRSRNAVAR